MPRGVIVLIAIIAASIASAPAFMLDESGYAISSGLGVAVYGSGMAVILQVRRWGWLAFSLFVLGSTHLGWCLVLFKVAGSLGVPELPAGIVGTGMIFAAAIGGVTGVWRAVWPLAVATTLGTVLAAWPGLAMNLGEAMLPVMLLHAGIVGSIVSAAWVGTRPPIGDLCMHCGYDRTGLTSARCPECGKPNVLRTDEVGF
ncbi:MAG: hypothetical protein HBSAPP03_11060 [Phycisphaerae bacterium]|nr:MAG: hypothetical protein HBSAPP03_11060 [Phycisphaerae bacterium]